MKPTHLRLGCIGLLVGLLAIGACTTTPTAPASAANRTAETIRPLLNSDRIRQKFGSYGIEVVRAGERLRVSNLFSIEQGRKITRTLAVVIYPPEIAPAVLSEHAEILHGSSIGAVFRRHGWDIQKQNIYIGQIAVSSDFSGVYAAMGRIRPADLAVHIYQLWVAKGGSRLRYATIAEVHHPGYLEVSDLRDIYGEEDSGAGPGSEDVQNALDTVVRQMEDF